MSEEAKRRESKLNWSFSSNYYVKKMWIFSNICVVALHVPLIIIMISDDEMCAQNQSLGTCILHSAEIWAFKVSWTRLFFNFFVMKWRNVQFAIYFRASGTRFVTNHILKKKALVQIQARRKTSLPFDLIAGALSR